MKQSKKIALGSMMCALATCIMLFGGAIPFATFCCPAIAAIALIPMLFEGGAWITFAATALLSLMLCPDKEAALLYLFMGYYPIVRGRLDLITIPAVRILAKLALMDGAAGLMLACSVFVLNMQSILAEYSEMSAIMLALYIILCNVTLLLCDQLYSRLTYLYIVKFKK